MSTLYNEQAAELRGDLEPVVESIEALQAVMLRNRPKGDHLEVVISAGGQSTAVPCKVQITGDTVGDRKEIEKIFLDKGWTCTTDASNNKKSTCTSPK